MIGTQLAERVLLKALGNGADFAELFLEDSEACSLQMLNGNVEKAMSSRSCGAGIRVLLGTRSAYAYASSVTEEALLKTAAAAAAALRGEAALPGIRFGMKEYGMPARIPFREVENAARTELMRRACEAAQAVSPEVSRVSVRYLDRTRRTEIFNSEGLAVRNEEPRTRLYVQAVAAEGAQAQTGGRGPGRCMGFETYRTCVDVEAEARMAAESALTMLHADECPAGTMPVVIDGGFGGVIFHEACGHSLEATSVGPGNSEFAGKLGTQIAAECVSAVDDGTMPCEWGSIGCDDEGVLPQRNELIRNGILVGYMIDRLGSRQLGMPATGSARRESYAYAATSRMTNTFICPGKDDDAEMIRSMDRGLYAKNMGGGSVNPVTGEFNFAVEEGYWVEHGAVVRPVRGATLVGRGADVLKKIDRVGAAVTLGQGMCGSRSGSIPVNVGQPRIRISSITVGGRGGKIDG